MAQTSSQRRVPDTGVRHGGATRPVGWVLFGGVLLVLLGTLHLGIGLAALLRPEVLAGTRSELLFPIGLTALAWVHVALGAVVAVVGLGLMRGRRWARPAAIQVGCLAAVVNFAFVGVQPVWSVTALMLSALVIYGVTAHGADGTEASGDA